MPFRETDSFDSWVRDIVVSLSMGLSVVLCLAGIGDLLELLFFNKNERPVDPDAYWLIPLILGYTYFCFRHGEVLRNNAFIAIWGYSVVISAVVYWDELTWKFDQWLPELFSFGESAFEFLLIASGVIFVLYVVRSLLKTIGLQ